jgi:membrane associated rhomboid family serine protease
MDRMREELRRKREESDVANLVKLIDTRLQQDKLLEPRNDSAAFYLAQARAAGASAASLQTQSQEIYKRLAQMVHADIDQRHFSDADRLLTDMHGFGYSVAATSTLQHDLSAARAAQSAAVPEQPQYLDLAQSRLAQGKLTELSGFMILFNIVLLIFLYHRWWTVLSAAWLHAGLLHILFNMMAMRQLAPPTAEFYGPGRTIIIYTAGSVVGFTLSSCALVFLPSLPFLHGSAYTVGASASICGLIGALLYYGRRTGSTIVRSEATRFIIMLGVYGLIMPGILRLQFDSHRSHQSPEPVDLVSLDTGVRVAGREALKSFESSPGKLRIFCG